MPRSVRRSWFAHAVLWAALVGFLLPAMTGPLRAASECLCRAPVGAAAAVGCRAAGGPGAPFVAGPVARAHPKSCAAPCCGPTLRAAPGDPDQRRLRDDPTVPSVETPLRPVDAHAFALPPPAEVAAPSPPPPRADRPPEAPRVLRC